MDHGRREASSARRAMAGMLVVVLVAAGLGHDAGAGPGATAGFTDVAPTDYYADAVRWARSQGITTGVGGSTRFEPHRPVTRGEAIVFLWRAAGRPRAAAAGMVDVAPTDYYADAVDWAVARAITTGVGGSRRVEPDRPITRAEAVTLMWRHAGSPASAGTTFVDVAGHRWAVPAIGWAEATGVTTGVGGGHRFEPGRAVTRAEDVTMLWRATTASATGSGQSARSTSPPTPRPTPTTRPAPPTSPPPTSPPPTSPPPTAPPPTTGPPPSGAGFVHPGVVVDQAQLDHVRARLASGHEPWRSALQKVRSTGSSTRTERRGPHRYSSLAYPPAPVPVIQAASAGNAAYLHANPHLGLANVGDVEHLDDARAAYTHALLWYYTGDRKHADKAIEIMNAWSSTLVEIKFDHPRRHDNGGHVFNNGKLQAGWGASLLTRAAEIIRYSDAGWSAADVRGFERMLTDVYLPLVITGWSNGANWLMTFAEATLGIGVFTDDRATFDAGVRMWREKVPTTIYLPTDGPRPRAPDPYYDTQARMTTLWHQPSQFVAGLQAETLRDLSHMAMGLGAMANAAETARIQGVDLYAEEHTRILAGYELQADYVNQYLDEVARRGGAQPASTWRPQNWVGSDVRPGGEGYAMGWEVAYNHYAVRQGHPMPHTERLVERTRPSGTALHMSWETLTHAR